MRKGAAVVRIHGRDLDGKGPLPYHHLQGPRRNAGGFLGLLDYPPDLLADRPGGRRESSSCRSSMRLTNEVTVFGS